MGQEEKQQQQQQVAAGQQGPGNGSQAQQQAAASKLLKGAYRLRRSALRSTWFPAGAAARAAMEQQLGVVVRFVVRMGQALAWVCRMHVFFGHVCTSGEAEAAKREEGTHVLWDGRACDVSMAQVENVHVGRSWASPDTSCAHSYHSHAGRSWPCLDA